MMSAAYINKIRTLDGDMQIDHNALANLSDLLPFLSSKALPYTR